MSKLLFIEPSWFGSGLSNELFFIIYGIIDCINNKKENLIINKFRTEPLTNNFCEISEVLDIHHLNILLRKFNITIFDREKLNFSIKNINYGFNNNFMNLTEDIVNNYYTNNKLLIPSGVILNNIKGDPYPGEMKELIIDYNLNNNVVTEKYSEYIHNDIIIDLNKPLQVLDWSQIDDCYLKNKDIFDFLLKNIKFNNRLVRYSENPLLINSSGEYEHLRLIDINNKKINVIHLRVEKDMTGHMLSHNKMTQDDYDIFLQNKYIELIDKYFLKDDIIFILSYDLNNNIINFLRENNYKFYISKKNIFNGREKHAIIDLLIGEKCNNIFIGNWDFIESRGSTFSYVLYIRNNAIKNIFIDMYDIKSNEVNKSNFLVKNNETNTLKELVNNIHTDKNTEHSYLDLYENLLCSKKHTAKNILEIGIGYEFKPNGGSIKLWYDYFLNANIYALDIQHIDGVWNEIKDKDRIKLLTSINAYDEENVKKLFLNKNITFDMVLDDGPHTLDSMKQFIKLYSKLMTQDGILIIEDVQSIDWIEELIKVVPENLKEYISIFDLREHKNRFDDIVFVINKNKLFVDNSINGSNSIKYILQNNIECGVYKYYMSFCIIVARYNENVEWTKQFPNVIIYNKGSKLDNNYNEIFLNNVGREGHTYYKYICDNYENLAEYTIFLQGRPFDHSPNIISNLTKYINNINNKELSIDFEFLSEQIIHSSLDLECSIQFQCKNIHKNWERVFGVNIDNQECVFGAGAQFIVSKKKILKNTKEFYENIVKMLDYDIDPLEGYDIERFHKYIFI